MRPNILNRICAHPIALAWIVGAVALNGFFARDEDIRELVVEMAVDWRGLLGLLLAIVSLSGMGFFLGMFTVGPLIRIICKRLNGAPLKIGDKVMILSGPCKGDIAEVYEIVIGQGGWNLARLDLGNERAERFKDIFEEYSVFKIEQAAQTLPSSID